MDPSDVKAMKENLLLKAKFAQKNRLYEEMYFFMYQIIHLTDAATDLSSEERSLLGAALRNYLRSSQKGRRKAITFTQSCHNEFVYTSACVHRTEQEISRACKEILDLIDIRLLPSADSKESKVFYLILKGDYSWYLAEVKGPIAGKGDADMAFNAYTEAQMIMLTLVDQNLHRFDLNLSLAEHSYWFLNAPEKASKYVDCALSEALSISKQSAATSLLSFEGSIGLIEDLEHLKKKIEKSKNKKIKNEARPSNVWPAMSPEAPHF